ncbi:MAG: TetR/AcrR family transcriptional regulator [Flavobacteriaceae bacterium]|nr:TetR/AcrR family transcriptional regulator [Flavobacteriaceae bacterium]
MNRKHQKSEILDKGILLMCRGGYHQTGVTDILNACQIPKGSFYNFFESKEQFTLEAIAQYERDLLELLDKIHLGKQASGYKKIETYFREVVKRFQSTGFNCSCLLGNLSTEVGADFPRISEAISQTRMEIKTRLVTFIDLHFDSEKTIEETGKMADFLLDAFYGVLTRMKVERNGLAFSDFFEFQLPFILKK